MPVTNSSLLSLLLHPSSLGKKLKQHFISINTSTHFNMGLTDAGGAEAN